MQSSWQELILLFLCELKAPAEQIHPTLPVILFLVFLLFIS